MEMTLDWNFVAVLAVVILCFFGLLLYGYRIEVQRNRKDRNTQVIQDIIDRLDWLERRVYNDKKDQ